VARDRQRAKQRKARRAAQNPGPEPTEPHRSNVPGELEHASGDADEFDAAIVAGADGEPLDGEPLEDEPLEDEPLEDEPLDERLGADAPEAARDVEPAEPIEPVEAAAPVERRESAERPAGARSAAELTDEEPLDEDDEDDAALEREAVAAGRGRRSEVAHAPAAGAPSRGGPARFLAFLRASWAELQRVQWPDRRQVVQATAVVIGFVIVAGVYLGVADRVAREIVDFII